MRLLHYCLFSCLFAVSASAQNDSLPLRNRQVIEAVQQYGPQISPTYEKAVCTELVIGILSRFFTLTADDKKRIRIIVKEDVHKLIREGSALPKGVYHALTANGKGMAVDRREDVLPGDFVQFWYPDSWGHCGIVKSIDPAAGRMELYSSFPATGGYGVQQFEIPDYSWFVRLR